MWLEVFFKGLLIGFLASIPVGAVAVLCIQRTLSKGFTSGFVSSFGAVICDGIFATIAFFSLAMILTFIKEHLSIIQAIGGICIALVGVSIFFTNPVVQIRKNRAGKSSLWQDLISVFFITLANPPFILIYVALFATFGITSELDMFDSTAMLIGVVAGCIGWWFLLMSVINLFRKKFTLHHILWLNRISGAFITILGLLTILSMLFDTKIDEILPK